MVDVRKCGKMSKKSATQKCGKCKGKGHNRISCTKAIVGDGAKKSSGGDGKGKRKLVVEGGKERATKKCKKA
ncbi:putative transcription factor interactor and regulator CCHC(Zn) family [Helianthus annuus]|nr:putative transcription factor interactor and regulator CCHC(Zn) family [Helianthus annuus]